MRCIYWINGFPSYSGYFGGLCITLHIWIDQVTSPSKNWKYDVDINLESSLANETIIIARDEMVICTFRYLRLWISLSSKLIASVIYLNEQPPPRITCESLVTVIDRSREFTITERSFIVRSNDRVSCYLPWSSPEKW